MISFSVSKDHITVLVDAGSTSIFKKPSILRSVEHIFISHMHHDHVAMLPHIVLAQYKMRQDCGTSQSTTIYGLTSVDPLMQSMGLANGTEYTFVANIPSVLGPFRICKIVARHSAPGYTYSFEANGRRVVYTGDTAYSSDLVRFCEDADLLISEASYSDDRAAEAHQWGHMTPGAIAKLMKSSRAKLVLLLHFQEISGEKFASMTIKHLDGDGSDRLIVARDSTRLSVT
jgi:ribonuclease BN (tRNA processing enzyme)